MGRFSLFFLGTVSALAAWLLLTDRPQPARKPLPAKQAAELLQQAWADHHTRA